MYKNILIPVVFETPEITQTAFDAAQALAEEVLVLASAAEDAGENDE